jgi:hypothetical protein
MFGFGLVICNRFTKVGESGSQEQLTAEIEATKRRADQETREMKEENARLAAQVVSLKVTKRKKKRVK